MELCPKVMEVSCCIRAFNFGAVSKSDGSILLYKSLQVWSCDQKWWKVYASTPIDNLRSQPAFGRLRISHAKIWKRGSTKDTFFSLSHFFFTELILSKLDLMTWLQSKDNYEISTESWNDKNKSSILHSWSDFFFFLKKKTTLFCFRQGIVVFINNKVLYIHK